MPQAMKARGRRATTQEVLDVAIELERKTMALYTALLRTFRQVEELRAFWFAMARHEAGHCGALTLVKSLLEDDPSLADHRKVWFDEVTVTRLRSLLSAYLKEARRGVDIARALTMALDVESSELEDVVVDLLQVVRDRRWRDQAVQMLIHDLGDLSFMIEKYTHDEALLARADELVEHRVGNMRHAAGPVAEPKVTAGPRPRAKRPAGRPRTASGTPRGRRPGAASAGRRRR
jgi:rubrerythrin